MNTFMCEEGDILISQEEDMAVLHLGLSRTLPNVLPLLTGPDSNPLP